MICFTWCVVLWLALYLYSKWTIQIWVFFSNTSVHYHCSSSEGKKRKSNCVVTRKKNRSSIFKLAIKSCNFLYFLICRLFSYWFFKQLISLCSTIFVVSFSLTGKFLPKNVKHHPKLYSSFISKVEAYAIVLQASWGYPSFQSSALVSCQWCGIPRLFGQSSHFVWYGQSP